MSRLVTPLERSTRDVHRAYQRPDEYQDRVAKYIPAEVVGGYVSLDSIVSKPVLPPPPKMAFSLTDTAFAQAQAPATAEGATTLANAVLASLSSVAGVVFVLCLVLSPLYVWTLARRAGTNVWKAQALIATLAFVVWAYAIKGTVFFQNQALDAWAKSALQQPVFYNAQWGAALLVLFSLAVAFYQPKAD